MAWIPGGEFSMGAADPLGKDANVVGMQATADSRPIHRVAVDGFWMDTTEVTNRQFAEFVKATGYVTFAERKPHAPRNSRARRRRISLPVRWYSRRPTTPCRSIRTSAGGLTWRARTGATRKGPRAT